MSCKEIINDIMELPRKVEIYLKPLQYVSGVDVYFYYFYSNGKIGSPHVDRVGIDPDLGIEIDLTFINKFQYYYNISRENYLEEIKHCDLVGTYEL